jgi:hypothetical protein
MKKIIFSLLCVGFLFGACEDRLDVEQKGVTDPNSFYKTDDDALNALNNVYASLVQNVVNSAGVGEGAPVYNGFILLYNLCGDDYWQGGGSIKEFPETDEFNFFNYTPTNVILERVYRKLYGIIYDCNLVIGNIEPDTSTKQRVCAEARTIRAWAHLMLAIGWGNPPLIETVLTGDAKPANYEGGHDGLLEWCAKEAEDAVQYLIERESQQDKAGASRVTKGFAWTVAGKARLFMKDYEGARTQLKKVIDSKKYELVPTGRWADLFHSSGNLSEEMIFQVNAVWDSGIGIMDWFSRISFQFNNHWNWNTKDAVYQPTFTNVQGWGAGHIRADFAKKMLDNDGDSERRKKTFYTADEFLYSEGMWPKGYKADGTYMTRAELETAPGISIHRASGLNGVEGYFAWKHIARDEDMQMGFLLFKNITLFRYAEVLLMYAEACAMTSDGSDDADGLKYLNQIQTRAGSKYISPSLTLQDVKNEKSFEMWLEGVRWADMVRWGDTSGVEQNGEKYPVTYDRFSETGKHEIYVEYNYDVNKGAKYGFKKGIHEYFAFPHASVSVNPNIVQNPSGTYIGGDSAE